MTGRLVSVNVGLPREVEWFGRTVVTSIWKTPVDGRVRAEGINLVGDGQADHRVHGGRLKSVYAYAVEDYEWWTAQGYDVGPGTFGDNFTVSGIDCTAAEPGDVWRIGTAVFGATQPRQPCFKLGIRMGTAEFVQRFDEAARPGTYLTILEPGDVGAGDVISVEKT